MKWVSGVVLAALAATVTINVLMLGYGGTSNDPVGRLSPVANLQLPAHVRGDDRHASGADD